MKTETTYDSPWWLIALGFAIRYWFVILIAVGLISWGVSEIQQNAARDRLTDQGFVETGQEGTAAECIEQGGTVDEAANVCLLP